MRSRRRVAHVLLGVLILAAVLAVGVSVLAQPPRAQVVQQEAATVPAQDVHLQQGDATRVLVRVEQSQAEYTHQQTTSVNATPVATPYPPSDNCVNCHTDKAKLQKLAEKPKEAKSELTSGEG